MYKGETSLESIVIIDMSFKAIRYFILLSGTLEIIAEHLRNYSTDLP